MFFFWRQKKTRSCARQHLQRKLQDAWAGCLREALTSNLVVPVLPRALELRVAPHRELRAGGEVWREGFRRPIII